MDRHDIAGALTRYFADTHDVTVAYLFGSTARGDRHGKSDIDIGVLFASNLDDQSRLFRRIQMAQELEDLLSRPVDVVDLQQTPPHFSHHVLRHKVIVKGYTEPARIEFEKDVRRHYFDMLPYRRRYEDARLRSLREGGSPRGRRGPNQGTLEAARRIHQRLGGRPGQ